MRLKPTLLTACMLLSLSVSAREAVPDSSFRARVGIHLDLNFFRKSDDHLVYNISAGLTTFYTSRSAVLSMTPGVRSSTKKGNASLYSLDQLEFEIRKNETSQVYDTITGTIVVSGQEITSIAIAPRYEFDFIFLKKRMGYFKPYMGLSSMVFYKYTRNIPANANLYKTSYSSVGTELAFLPGLIFSPQDKFYCTLSFPLFTAVIALNTNKTDNPNLPEKSRRTTTYGFDPIPGLRARISFGFYVR